MSIMSSIIESSKQLIYIQTLNLYIANNDSLTKYNEDNTYKPQYTEVINCLSAFDFLTRLDNINKINETAQLDEKHRVIFTINLVKIDELTCSFCDLINLISNHKLVFTFHEELSKSMYGDEIYIEEFNAKVAPTIETSTAFVTLLVNIHNDIDFEEAIDKIIPIDISIIPEVVEMFIGKSYNQISLLFEKVIGQHKTITVDILRDFQIQELTLLQEQINASIE